MILLGLAGPASGAVIGYGIARGLRQSIYRLSVRVHDIAQQLESDVATINVVADGDFRSLDQQMQQVVGRVEEVAERLQLQRRKLLQAEQLAAVGQLAAGVAHEVRNPLTGIKMLVEAAKRPQNPRPLNAEDLDVIHRELGRVEQTVQGLLDYARLPSPQLGRHDVGKIVRQALEVVRPRADQQRVAIDVQDPGRGVCALLDPDQIHRVLVNLFLNALDAMPAGGSLRVNWNSVAHSCTITVADSGPGIPEAILDRLFTPFATTKATGTGLGLSLSSRIIDEHRGALTAANPPEGGARFTITLSQPPAGNRQ
jgi:signal transduction histidine kinase